MDRTDSPLVDDGESGDSLVIDDPGTIRVLYVGERQGETNAPVEMERRHEHLEVTIEESTENTREALEDGDYDCVIYAQRRPGDDVRVFSEAVREVDRRLPVIVYGGPAVLEDVYTIDGVDLVRRGEEGEYAVLTSRVRNATSRKRATERLGQLETQQSVQRRLTEGLLESQVDAEVTTVARDEHKIATTVQETLLKYDPISRVELARYDRSADDLEVVSVATAGDGCEDGENLTYTDGESADGATSALESCHGQGCGIFEETIRSTEVVTTTDCGQEGTCHTFAVGEGDCLAVLSVAIDADHHVILAAVTERCHEDDLVLLEGATIAVAQAMYATHLESDLRRFRNAVDHAGHVVLITDEEGRMEYVNPAFEEETGYDSEEAIGRTPAMLSSGEHDESFYEDLWETILDGEVWQNEVVNERKDGTSHVIDQTIAPIENRRGDLEGFVAVNKDVTARKERERDLAFLKRAVDQVGIGMGTFRSDGRATYVNERLAEVLGATREAVKDTHLADLNAEFERDRFEDYWSSFEEGETRIRETRFQRLDTGEEVPVEVVSSRITIDGESYQVGTVRDISDRRRREHDLRRFRSAVEHAGHGVVITGIDGTIEYVNEAFEEMSGYSAAEVIGQTPAVLKSGEHDEPFYEDLWETILDGDAWRGEIVNRRSDGERYVIDQTIAPIEGEDEPVGFVAINNDITELKEYERELEAQNDRLEQYGRMVAHDLRNPLTLLSGEIEHLRIALDTEPETEFSEIKDEIQQGLLEIEGIAEYMRRLIDDLLQLAEQGQIVLDAEEVDLEPVARKAWQEIESPEAELAVENCRLEANPDRLRELVSNLFRNAVEHGGEDVTVRAGPLDFSEGFYVEDDGPGIPEDEREKVLDRGYTTAEDGTGFGLAVTTRIAEAHEWAVRVTESAEGGARFEFHPE
ncbi:hybrid sensor histidine kinase/response regulator [Natrialbaceae archaeon A-gly3]